MKVALSQGRFSKVSHIDFGWVRLWKWSLTKNGEKIYAVRREGGRKNRKSFYLHRMIVNAKKGQEVDHINGDTLDNRRENLRICTRSKNLMNAKKRATNGSKPLSSRFKGVSWDRAKKKWMVSVKGKFVGRFKSEMAAAKAYNERAKRLFGKFAKLNPV